MVKLIVKITGLVLIASVSFVVWFWFASQSKMAGAIALPGLQKTVQVQFDSFAIPTITAQSQADAYRALGYLSARERFFQMDLMRRKMAGRLAEIIGAKALALDITNRHLGFSLLAQKIVKKLPRQQRHIVDAYSQGINAYLEQMNITPVEFWALNYTPEPWHAEDSLLVSLAMFQMLNQNLADETMLTVMKAALPSDVVSFLTPDSDIYQASVLLYGNETSHDLSVIPVQSIAELLANNSRPIVNGLLKSQGFSAGSNQWATNKTADGRAILANDMHLPLSVPGLWYQAELRYQQVKVRGISLPGLPLIIAGSNGSLAWGFTNAQADVLDLAKLTLNPANPNQYLTEQGWRDFDQRIETIKIKGAADHQITLQSTRWGPVSEHLLMGQKLAVQWSIYQADAVNLDLMAMASTKNIDAALDLFNRAGLPALNVMLADDQGQIAWTLTGKIPKRHNFDGSVSVSRGLGDFTWQGFVATDDYPRVINPDSGLLMTANNRVLAKQQGFNYGQNFANSYRAYRIKQGLQQASKLSAQQLHELQLDTRSEFYEFYRQQALSVLTQQSLQEHPELLAAQRALLAWKGYADSDSIGFGLLVKFRMALADTLFSAYLQPAFALDKNFRYRWFNQDTPLRSLLTVRNKQTLPGGFGDWDQLLATVLLQVVKKIRQQHPESDLAALTWGEMATVKLEHPLGSIHPWLAILLNMPQRPQAGCGFCVRVANGSFSASMRLVVSPGHEDEMILVSPTGQSGKPLSPHYADQFDYWVEGLILEREKYSSELLFKPEHELAE